MVPVTLSLCLAGLGTSSYLTYVHYTEPTSLACPDTGIVNCTKVTTSAQSMVGPVPVAVLGIVFFAAMLVLCLPVMWRMRNRWVERARLGGVAAGMVMVLYLVGAELISIRAICAWCTVVHVLTFALFLACLAATLSLGEAPPDR